MGKESLTGPKFYSNMGFKRVTLYLPKGAYTKLVKLARREDRSLQKTIRRIVLDYAKKI